MSVMRKHDAQQSTHDPKTVKDTKGEAKQPNVGNAEAKILVILSLSLPEWVMGNIFG